jgi:hypothetical protein
MISSTDDYKKLYQLQDKFLSWWHTLGFPFYLTGGTALGRFYLNHRFSEDLDFFCNSLPDYQFYITALKSEISLKFAVDLKNSLFTEDYTRFYIGENNQSLKVELANEVAYYPGKPLKYDFGWIDTPLNILSNKLTAILGRDEPKDIYDIIMISMNYSFSWPDIFYHSKQKSVINEIDIAGRLYDFPIEWMENVRWLSSPVDVSSLRKNIRKVADDFFLGKENSLGSKKISIDLAQPGLLTSK